MQGDNRTIYNEKNSPFKRGVVIENDDEKVRSKVEITDEGKTSSYWLKINQPMSGGSKHYEMPDVGSQVNVIMDWDGEDGTIIGSIYSEKDKPPTTNGRQVMRQMDDGSIFQFDKSESRLYIKIGPFELIVQDGVLTINAVRIELIKS